MKKCETYKSRLERFKSSSDIGDGDCWPEDDDEDSDGEKEQQDSSPDEDDDIVVVVNDFPTKSREVSSEQPEDSRVFVARVRLVVVIFRFEHSTLHRSKIRRRTSENKVASVACLPAILDSYSVQLSLVTLAPQGNGNDHGNGAVVVINVGAFTVSASAIMICSVFTVSENKGTSVLVATSPVTSGEFPTTLSLSLTFLRMFYTAGLIEFVTGQVAVEKLERSRRRLFVCVWLLCKLVNRVEYGTVVQCALCVHCRYWNIYTSSYNTSTLVQF